MPTPLSPRSASSSSGWRERPWEQIEPDRVLATVLFTDIVGSTEKAVTLGDARWSELLHEHHSRVRGQLARFRGREIDTAGDGFFASFDGPARAIRCAGAVRDAVAELGIEIRAGLHAGECELIDGKVGRLPHPQRRRRLAPLRRLLGRQS
jgi:class 3 adenylate cyclase